MRTSFKTRAITASVLSSVLLMSVFNTGQAQDEILPGKFFGLGARAMGMGGAFVAVADDYSALYWNPAGLAQLPRIEFFGSLSHDRMKNSATYYGFRLSDSQSKTRLNALGLAYPVPTVRGSLVFGLGYNRISSFDHLLTIASNRTPSEDIDAWETEAGGLGAWSIGGALDVSPSLSLGAALDIWTGEDAYTWDYVVTDLQNPLRGYRYLDTIDGDYSGVGIKFGGLLRAGKYVSLGLTISSPVSFTVNEFWTQQTDTLSFMYYDEGEFEYDITTPYRFGLGGSLSLRHLTLAADVEYVDWTQTEYTSPHWMVGDNWIFNTSYRDVYTFHVGAEYEIPRSDVTLRAGYLNDPLPYTDTHIQRDRDYITLGAGVLVDNIVKVDFALVHGLWEKTDSNLTEKIQTDRVFLSMAYRF
jgi:long-chain fatty acid transport protein